MSLYSTPQKLVERALMILWAAAGLGIDGDRNSHWEFGADTGRLHSAAPAAR